MWWACSRDTRPLSSGLCIHQSSRRERARQPRHRSTARPRPPSCAAQRPSAAPGRLALDLARVRQRAPLAQRRHHRVVPRLVLRQGVAVVVVTVCLAVPPAPAPAVIPSTSDFPSGQPSPPSHRISNVARATAVAKCVAPGGATRAASHRAKRLLTSCTWRPSPRPATRGSRSAGTACGGSTRPCRAQGTPARNRCTVLIAQLDKGRCSE